VVFVAGALPPHPHKELSFLDLVHFGRYAFKKAKVFGVPFFQKGDKKSLTTQDTKEPHCIPVFQESYRPSANVPASVAVRRVA
jgi:hypothetical protein